LRQCREIFSKNTFLIGCPPISKTFGGRPESLSSRLLEACYRRLSSLTQRFCKFSVLFNTTGKADNGKERIPGRKIQKECQCMGKQGFFYNQSRCVGCKTCQIACKDKNDLPIGILFRRVSSYETGIYPKPFSYHFSATCNHCSTPACATVCPTGAMHVDEVDGTVRHDDSMCIGCQYCVGACPYGNPRYIEELMVVHKCDACVQLRNAGERPACVASCPSRALEFGQFEDLKEAYPDAVCDLPILPNSSMTAPSLLIKPRASALFAEYRETAL